MGRRDGPHTRNSMPGAIYRGSRRRVDRLDPFGELPAAFWVFVAIGLAMFGLSLAMIYAATLPQ
jgi:hypothetical protein